MAKELIHLLQSAFLSASIPERSGAWQPPVDVYQTRDGWLLKADLAGVNPEDVAVELHERRITIRGQRRDWCLEEGCCYLRMEIAYNRFERTIELPDDLGLVRVATEFRHGMLLIRIRKNAR